MRLLGRETGHRALGNITIQLVNNIWEFSHFNPKRPTITTPSQHTIQTIKLSSSETCQAGHILIAFLKNHT